MGFLAKIDVNDFDLVNKYKWYFSGKYAARNYKKENGKKSIQFMHIFLMGTPRGMDTDHINGDKLDNRRSNLRVVTRSQNMSNLWKVQRNSSSKFKGVCWDRKKRKWLVQANGKFVGYFKDELAAATAYDNVAMVVYGGNAILNSHIMKEHFTNLDFH